MLVLFMVSMLIGLVSLMLLVLSFISKKFKPSRKKFGVLFLVAIFVFFASTFGYYGTLTDEERLEIDNQQGISEQEKLDQEAKNDEQSTQHEDSKEDVKDSTLQESNSSELNTAEQSINSDLEVITREGHPTYYGSVETSHSVWDDVKKGKIIFADSYYSYNDATILSMDAYRNSDLIRGISVYFNNFEEPCEMTVDEVLPIIASYMPYDIMDKYYQFKGSELIQPGEDRDDRNHYYVISYNLTDSGKDTYYSKEHEYSGSIDVIINTNQDGIVESFNIDFGTPRWMSSLSINSYHKVEWNCDLYKYR